MPFQKGQSGNPKGRPRGSRNKLAESFTSALQKDFDEHGIAAIEKVRSEDPSQYLRVIASVIPKEVEATVHNISAKQLADDELANIALGSGEGADSTPVDPSQLN